MIIGGGLSPDWATAIHLADQEVRRIVRTRRILLIEKGASVGSHILSGAVIKTDVFRSLLPDVDFAEIPFNAKAHQRCRHAERNGKIHVPFHPSPHEQQRQLHRSVGSDLAVIWQKSHRYGRNMIPDLLSVKFCMITEK